MLTRSLSSPSAGSTDSTSRAKRSVSVTGKPAGAVAAATANAMGSGRKLPALVKATSASSIPCQLRLPIAASS